MVWERKHDSWSDEAVWNNFLIQSNVTTSLVVIRAFNFPSSEHARSATVASDIDFPFIFSYDGHRKQ